MNKKTKETLNSNYLKNLLRLNFLTSIVFVLLSTIIGIVETYDKGILLIFSVLVGLPLLFGFPIYFPVSNTFLAIKHKKKHIFYSLPFMLTSGLGAFTLLYYIGNIIMRTSVTGAESEVIKNEGIAWMMLTVVYFIFVVVLGSVLGSIVAYFIYLKRNKINK